MWRSFLLACGWVWAQIQIQAGDLPSAGGSYTVSQSRGRLQVDFLTAGPGHTWDFTQLPADTQFTLEWKGPWQVPQYVFSCGNASLQALLLKIADSLPSQGGISIRDMYAFLRKSSSKMTVEGVGISVNGAPLTQCYQDPDEIYVLPLSYGDRDSTTFWLRFSFPVPNMGTVTFAQRGYRIHRVDGYGQVSTPAGSYACLRLRRDVREKDTVYFNGFPVQRRDTAYTELEWLGQGEGVPLLRVQGSFMGSNFIPAVVQFKGTRQAASVQGGSRPAAQIGPNPTRGTLTISPARGQYAVYSLVGQIMAEGEVPPSGQVLLPPTLSEGVYFLRLQQDGHTGWYRFILLR